MELSLLLIQNKITFSVICTAKELDYLLLFSNLLCELLEVSPEDHALHQANISHAHTDPSVQIRHKKRTTRQIKLPAANSTGNSNRIASEKRLTKINKSQ